MSTQAEKDAIVIDATERLIRQIRRDQEQLSISTRMAGLGPRLVESRFPILCTRCHAHPPDIQGLCDDCADDVRADGYGEEEPEEED